MEVQETEILHVHRGLQREVQKGMQLRRGGGRLGRNTHDGEAGRQVNHWLNASKCKAHSNAKMDYE